MNIIETIILTPEDLRQLKKETTIYADGEKIKGTIQLRLLEHELV